MEVKLFGVAATGLCAAGKQHCGKAESEESDLWLAHSWNKLELPAMNWFTSLIGYPHWLAWQEEPSIPQSHWMDLTCGPQSGELERGLRRQMKLRLLFRWAVLRLAFSISFSLSVSSVCIVFLPFEDIFTVQSCKFSLAFSCHEFGWRPLVAVDCIDICFLAF